jgi:hypothetical protein
MSFLKMDSAARKVHKMRTRALVAACVAAALPLTAFALPVRRMPTVLPHALSVSRTLAAVQHPRFRPVKQGPHTFYGKIVSLGANRVVILTRHNRLINVDTTIVLAAGTFSAPLFVGKLVAVDGDQPATGAFTAAHIWRLTNLNSLNSDH